MKDVAAESDARGITIDRVGIRDLHLPVRIKEKDGGYARVLGQIEAGVELPHVRRGTHMSRFMEILSEWSKQAVSMAEMEATLRRMLREFSAPAAQVMLEFKYFLCKRAPASGQASQLDYDCSFEGTVSHVGFRFVLGASVPILTLCPCSKEISDRGAHSQRAMLSVRVNCRTQPILWLEDLIPMLEKQGSCEIYPLLKRTDEKMVTELAYDNPKFVEDVVRDTIVALRDNPAVLGISAQCDSIESIHNHVAYAYAEHGEL
jgi:GTP cyclohydrolase I